jgi:Cupredoxin-like domain
MTMPMRASMVLALAALATANVNAPAEDTYSATITIRNHRFEPSEIHVPAGRQILLTVVNADPLSEEFDSKALKIEKVIAGGKEGSVRLRPLDSGRYPFIGECRAHAQHPKCRHVHRKAFKRYSPEVAILKQTASQPPGTPRNHDRARLR